MSNEQKLKMAIKIANQEEEVTRIMNILNQQETQEKTANGAAWLGSACLIAGLIMAIAQGMIPNPLLWLQSLTPPPATYPESYLQSPQVQEAGQSQELIYFPEGDDR
jgi:hypothetical protein